MNYRVFLFSRRELKIIMFGALVGSGLQFICWKYLKNHPELLDNYNSEKVDTKKPGSRRFFPRGGELISLTGAKIFIDITGAIFYISKNGVFVISGLTTMALLTKKIPSTAVIITMRNALPITHTDFDKRYLLVHGKKIVLDQCDNTLEYMFKVLTSKDIPFENKKETSFKILMEHVDLRTSKGRFRFMFCIISIIQIISLHDSSSYFIIMENLIKAIKNGKISKRLARLIIRTLIKLKINIDPELIDAAAYT